MTSRRILFKKNTRKNQEFERFLCGGQEAAVLDATTSKYIPLSYFVTPISTTKAEALPQREAVNIAIASHPPNINATVPRYRGQNAIRDIQANQLATERQSRTFSRALQKPRNHNKS